MAVLPQMLQLAIKHTGKRSAVTLHLAPLPPLPPPVLQRHASAHQSFIIRYALLLSDRLSLKLSLL